MLMKANIVDCQVFIKNFILILILYVVLHIAE